MIFSLMYNNQVLDIEAESVVHAIIQIIDCIDTDSDKTDFELLAHCMKAASYMV